MKTTPQETMEERFRNFIENETMIDWRIAKDFLSFIKSEIEKARQESVEGVLREVEELVRLTENLEVGIEYTEVSYKDGYLDAKNDIRIKLQDLLSTLESKE